MAFVNLNRSINTTSRLHRKKKGSWGKFLTKLFIIVLILFVAVYLPLRSSYAAIKRLSASARALQEAAKNENLDQIRTNIKEMKTADDDLNGSLNFLIWVRVIPYIGGFYADAKHFASAGSQELQAVSTLADTLDPYKTELGFIGQPTPGTDKVSQMVKVLDKVIPQLDKVVPQLKAARDEVSSVDTNKYPENFGQTRIKSRIETAKNLIMGLHYAVTEARPALEIAPSALGSPNAKTYLLIFQNDKELRSTGGFMTAYTFMTLDKGHVSATTSDDIYQLDTKLLERCKSIVCPLTPPDPIARYLPEANGKPRTAWSMRDSNLSPDLPTSMKTFEGMYTLLPEQQRFDGIILIDTKVVEELIKITGPIDIYGTTYSSDMEKSCDCSKVVYAMENYSQIAEKGEQGRKAILGTLMQQILTRSLGAATDKLPEFINAGITLASQKHILVYMHDQKTQDALGQLNWTGKIKQVNGDYLHINDSNLAGGKSNLYVTEDVSLEISNNTHHKLIINYSNPKAYGAWLNAINRDYVRVYVPQGSKLAVSKGSEAKVISFDELGKTVFEAFVQVRPQNNLTLSFEYDVPAGVKTDQILVQKQPGTKDFHYSIKVNGQVKANFNLTGDQDLKL